MLVSNSWCEETAKDIIWEFEQLLCKNNIKIYNEDLKESTFEREDSYINTDDYNKLKANIIKDLKQLVEYTEYRVQEAA